MIKEITPLKELGIDLEPHLKKLNLSGENVKYWPNFAAHNRAGKYEYFVEESGLSKGKFDSDTNEKCKSSDKYRTICYTVLKDLQTAINTYKTCNLKKSYKIEQNKIDTKLSEWKKYFTEARSMLPWELVANDLIYKGKLNKKGFVSPPQYQLTLGHPNITYEYTEGADDGSKFKESFALELIGVNFWNLKVPVGASVTLSYTDHSAVDNLGYGALIHIDNKYSIGVSRYGDEMAYSISVDLFKLFESGEEKYNKFLSYIN
jgi:hypothetical protein